MKILTVNEKQDRLVSRLIKKCDTDKRYSLRIEADNIANIHDKKSHMFSLVYFIGKKRINSYLLSREIYRKYESDKRFKVLDGNANMVILQYSPEIS